MIIADTHDEQSHYVGPYRPSVPQPPKRCIIPSCRKRLSPADRARKGWFCETHADPDGYLPRLKASSAAAKRRCVEAYPVCAACGRSLSHEAVKAGRTRHLKGEPDTCL